MSLPGSQRGLRSTPPQRSGLALSVGKPAVGRSRVPTNLERRRLPSLLVRRVALIEPSNDAVLDSEGPRPLKIAFGGAGIFFWWELGGVQWLAERYDLKKTLMVGASGGALAATLAATGIGPEEALACAYRLGKEYGIWERPLGLMGVWGQLTREWLQELLPENAGDLCRNRVELIVTKVPSFRLEAHSDFKTKDDLIDVNMTSVHVPFFMDGKPSRLCRGSWCIDGSFQDFLIGGNSELLTCEGNTVLFDYFQDEALSFERMDFLSLKEYDEVKKLMELGYQHAQHLHDSGVFNKFDDSMCRQRWRWPPRPQWGFSL